jgi:hypothetical protein
MLLFLPQDYQEIFSVGVTQMNNSEIHAYEEVFINIVKHEKSKGVSAERLKIDLVFCNLGKGKDHMVNYLSGVVDRIYNEVRS